MNATVDLRSSGVPSTDRETVNMTLKVAVSFKIIMTTSVTRSCFTEQHQNCKTKTAVCKTKTKTDFFWSQTGLVLRPTVSDHITGTESRASPKFGLVRRASTLFVMHFTFALIIISLLRQKAAQYNNIANTTIKGYLKNK